MRPDNLGGRMRLFFEANPDEELTFEDAATKFGTTVEAISKAVWRLKQFHHVEVRRVIRKPKQEHEP